MRDFKELLTGQGEDLFHKNMRKFGATVVESHQAFKDIKEGGNGGSAEEKLGMMYLSKAAIFEASGIPAKGIIPQEELFQTMLMLSLVFPIVGLKGTTKGASVKRSVYRMLVDELSEGKFTSESWNACALDWDALTYDEGNGAFIPRWKEYGSTIAEAKAALSQMLPNQMTEAEFFA